MGAGVGHASSACVGVGVGDTVVGAAVGDGVGADVTEVTSAESWAVPSFITSRGGGVGDGVGAFDGSACVDGAGVFVQKVGPMKLLLDDFPAGQRSQAPCPAEAWNVPALHAVQGMP